MKFLQTTVVLVRVLAWFAAALCFRTSRDLTVVAYAALTGNLHLVRLQDFFGSLRNVYRRRSGHGMQSNLPSLG
jgi:hypothetical protein